jgi:O-antigen ligase
MSRFCFRVSIALLICLPFLIPFEAFRNTELQGLILILAGVFAWISLLWQGDVIALTRLQTALLGIFVVCNLISLLVNPHKVYDLLGAPYLRLGTAGFLACVGCGLLLRQLPTSRLIKYLYLIISMSIWLSLPYNWLKFHNLLRIGGVFSQADVFAGCGLLLGMEALRRYPQRQALILGNQLLLTVVLILSETRAVILLVFILGLIWLIRHHPSAVVKQVTLGICLCLVIGLLGSYHFTANRLNNPSAAINSLRYRLDLQTAALQATTHKPLEGYGAGNVADALDCKTLASTRLQATCHEGYFFNSSHNIFLDRILAFGWLGGSVFLALVLLAVYRQLRVTGEYSILGYLVVLIAGYYCTNVTSITLELLLWILLIKLFSLQTDHDLAKK